MRIYLWLAAAVILMVLAGAVWYFSSHPAWVAGLVASAAASLWAAFRPALLNWLKLKTPEQYRKDAKTYGSGLNQNDKRPPGAGR